MERFNDRRVIVTGAGSGFGEAIAKRFADEGARVLVSDINEEGMTRVRDEILGSGGEAVSAGCNVAEESQVEAMVQVALDKFGGVDILVNNAGYSHHQRLMWKISVEEFDAVFAVNVRGVFLGCKHVIPHMIEGGGGVIVNIASVGAIAPRPGVTPYNGTKGAVLTMTKGLAMEVARNNIRVNAVNPVAADTGFMKGAMGVDSLDEEATARLVSTIPRGRLARPADIAAAVTYLASDDGDFLTGTSINVDGGRSV
ncbi:MAG: SDR family oxidoreductase [Pseudomonadales bacterium]|jgi:3-oxoacyl-[acyl-carrier protein] reductase|nr:SDR family oxidoreductase [Pseudomonadales bacterium]